MLSHKSCEVKFSMAYLVTKHSSIRLNTNYFHDRWLAASIIQLLCLLIALDLMYTSSSYWYRDINTTKCTERICRTFVVRDHLGWYLLSIWRDLFFLVENQSALSHFVDLYPRPHSDLYPTDCCEHEYTSKRSCILTCTH